MLPMMDFRLFGRSDQLHVALFAVKTFQEEFSRLPGPSEDDISKVMESAKAIVAHLKEIKGHTVEELEEDIVKMTASYSSSSLTHMSAFLGGIVAQEIVKFTGKYTPLRQWLHYDVFESLPPGEVNREPMGCRYDD